MFARVVYRPLAGFEWRDSLVPHSRAATKYKVGPWLTPARTEDTPVRIAEFPLRQPNLHREFANLEATPAAIKRFATRWGFLGRAPVPLVAPDAAPAAGASALAARASDRATLPT